MRDMARQERMLFAGALALPGHVPSPEAWA